MNQKRNTKTNRKAKWFAIVIVLLFIAIMAGLWTLQEEELDSQGCPRESGPSREVIVLLDTSDPLGDKHKAELGRILREMTDSAESGRHDRLAVREGERLTLYRLETTGIPDDPIAQICNPGGNPREQKPLDGFTRGAVITQWRWQQFVNVIQNLFPKKQPQAFPTSPILETIAVITARHTSSRRASQDVSPSHLVIISDLLQHTDKLSHYDSYLTPELLRGELKADLTNVEVSLFQLERLKYEKYQTPDLYYWWSDWVEAMGGRVVWQQAI